MKKSRRSNKMKRVVARMEGKNAATIHPKVLENDKNGEFHSGTHTPFRLPRVLLMVFVLHKYLSSFNQQNRQERSKHRGRRNALNRSDKRTSSELSLVPVE